MLTVTPKQLEHYASRMLNPLRDLLNATKVLGYSPSYSPGARYCVLTSSA